jgi:2-polyprenyl-3-methyl-5-hydroxy-6-metoxy-1,4-benzoquinol methylase
MALLSKFIADQRQKKVSEYIKGDVLDLGCCNARILETYGTRITSYSGVDRSAKLIEKLKQKYPNASFMQRDLDCERLELGSNFDCILMIALIEHLFNQKFVMEEVSKALKPGGIIVITTPTPFGNDVVHRLGAAIGLFAKSAVDDHIVVYNKHRFSILADEIGLRLRRHRYFQIFCNQIAILEKASNQSDA